MPRASSRILRPRPINGSTLSSAQSLAYSTGACASPSGLRTSRISRRIWIKRFAPQGSRWSLVSRFGLAQVQRPLQHSRASVPASSPSMRELLAQLVAFDTTSTKSNLELIAYVKDYLDSHGVASTL